MEVVTLYHRTTVENAERILSQRRMTSLENTNEAYFSTEKDGEGTGYGDRVVCIVIPLDLAELDDEFPSGERHYRVHVNDIKPEHFQI